ncbi:MAG: hypothetical protein ACOYLB_08170 [Phototrophicaceae bacterium]
MAMVNWEVFLNQLVGCVRSGRGVIINRQLQPLAIENFDREKFSDATFIATLPLEKAIQSGKIEIGNDAILSAQAPSTNTNMSDIRGVIIIPIEGQGALYLDQPIRVGIIPRFTVDKIAQLLHEYAQGLVTEADLPARLKTIFPFRGGA